MSSIFAITTSQHVLTNDLTLAPLRRKKRRNTIILCTSEKPTHFGLKRRQMLLASTSMRMPPTPALVFKPGDQVSNLNNYHKLQDARKHNFKYASDIDVASLFRPSGQTCDGSPAHFSAMVSFPSQHCSAGNYEFVEAKVCRPSFSEEFRDREEELIIGGIKVNRERQLWFDVYIRPASREGDNEYEYAGSFIHMPPRQKQPFSSRQKKQARKVNSCCLRMGISHILDDFAGAVHDQERCVIVTLVPKINSDHHPITVENICIQYS